MANQSAEDKKKAEAEAAAKAKAEEEAKAKAEAEAAAANANPPLEPKQAVVTPADTRGDSPKRLLAPGFRGSYKGYQFNDIGESEKPVPAEVVAELNAQFPKLEIEEID